VVAGKERFIATKSRLVVMGIASNDDNGDFVEETQEAKQAIFNMGVFFVDAKPKING
jgi:hypothetical protein